MRPVRPPIDEGIPVKRCILPLSLLLAPALVHAQNASQPLPYPQQERILGAEADLNVWCEQEARAHFASRNVEAYQWTSRYFNRSNMLFVEGTLRAGGKDVAVRCQAATGARERDASITIDD